MRSNGRHFRRPPVTLPRAGDRPEGSLRRDSHSCIVGPIGSRLSGLGCEHVAQRCDGDRRGGSPLLYWVFKWVMFAPLVRLLFRPLVEGEENLPGAGPAILVSNHIAAGDTFILPAMIRRRLTFPGKVELFHGRGAGGRIVSWFLRSIGQLPMDRSGGRASAGSMESVLGVLKAGGLLGIYPRALAHRMGGSTRERPVLRGSCCRPVCR